MGNSSSSSSGGGDGDERDDGPAGEGHGVGPAAPSPRRGSGLSRAYFSHRIVGGGSNNNSSDGGSGGRSSLLQSVHRNLPDISLPSPFRSGKLGLSKAEMDERCQPSGLYPECEWETRQIRRLIGDGYLAARLKGSDSRLSKGDVECPICFMYYSQSNVTKCCTATVCTECYLQIKHPKEKHSTCPFCNNPKMTVTVQSRMDGDAVRAREEEEQIVIEAAIRNRAAQRNGEGPMTPSGSGRGGDPSFGSQLENYTRSRARTHSDNESTMTESSEDSGTGPPGAALLSVAMSPEERRALERDMRAQLSHATHRRVEDEERAARTRHAQEWYGSAAGTRGRVREARLAELTGLLERLSGRPAGGAPAAGGAGRSGASLGRLLRAMESSNQGAASLEDLVRLESFFVGTDGDDGSGLFRTDGSRLFARPGDRADAGGADADLGPLGARGGPGGGRRGGRGVSATHLDTAALLMRGVSEEEQVAMAIAMSMQEEQELRHREATRLSRPREGGRAGSASGAASEGARDEEEAAG